jgi:glycosyltransferase involved in cell wall biosynthesis|tara:strand:+ start:130 stop:813 length:684 start_codon:yes stop_codon:yes gene_type:complete
MKKITFLITVYNEYLTVKDAIQEILSLKYENKEVIIIDNASTDGSQEIIKQFKNITLVLRKKNLGYGSTVMEGLNLATGDYLYVHNSDLEYDPLNAIEMLIFAESENLDVVFGSRLNNRYEIIKNLKSNPAFLATYLTTFLINVLYKKKFTDIIGSKLYKTDKIKNVKADFLHEGFDFGFVSRLCKEKYNIGEIFANYKPRENFSNKKIKWYHMFVALFAIFKVKIL